MKSTLNFPALLAASAFLCEMNKGELPEIALVKMLYEAERQALTRSYYTITGDNFVAYDKGPVLSNFLYILRGKSKKRDLHTEWQKYFELKNEKSDLPIVSLKEKPDMDEISETDKEYLSNAFGVYKSFLNDKTENKIVKYAHKRYKEWNEKHHTISHKNILEQKYDEEVIPEILAVIG